jgi:hypothetical protein
MTPREFLQVTDALNLRSTFGLVRRNDSERAALDSPNLSFGSGETMVESVRGRPGFAAVPWGAVIATPRGLLVCPSGGSRGASWRAETLGMVASWDAVTRRCAGWMNPEDDHG